MSILYLLCTVVISSVMNTDNPEDFLHFLSSGSAEQWIEYQYSSDGYQTIHQDSIRNSIESFDTLYVQPGERLIEDVIGGYKVIFPASHWSWRTNDGRIGSVTGESVIEWHPGGYSWVTVPVLTEKGASIGREESLCMGVTITAAIALVGVICIWYAKRRYG